MWNVQVGVQQYLTEEQQQQNANEIRTYLELHGLTLESICGILGNMDIESGLNPGNKRTENGAWGLIQWYPHSVLVDWCNEREYNWYNGGIQLYRIICEGEGTHGASGYWLKTDTYKYTWSEFCSLTNLKESTYAYAFERERSGGEDVTQRYEKAQKWYTFFRKQEPTDPDNPDDPPIVKPKKKMPLYMYLV